MKNLLLATFIILSNVAAAQDVVWNIIKGNNPHSEYPKVKIDDDKMIITSDTLMLNARIDIRNEEGLILFREFITLSPIDTVIDLHQNSKNSYAIVVSYDKTTLIGEVKNEK